MDNKQIWKAFFELEQSFYDYVIESCDELYNQDPPKFIEVNDQLKAPKYIRWIGRLKHDSSELQQRLAALKQAYQLAAREDFKSYPMRFCEYYEHVDQINITTNTAFRSRQLKPGFFTLFELNEHRGNKEALNQQESELAELIEQLKAYKIESRVKVEQSMFGLTHHFFQLNAKDVFSYFKLDKIQLREPSGQQFRGRVRYQGESAGERIKLGFIVVDRDSECRVVRSNEQAERPHSLVKQGRELFLPVERKLDTLFFDKS